MPFVGRACLPLLAISAIIAACAGPVASASPSSVQPTIRPSSTLNPNELARLSPSPSPSPTPVPSPSPTTLASATPIPTPTPLTEMQERIPALAGGGGSDPHVIDPTNLFGGFIDQVETSRQLFDSVGATASDFEGAAGRCCSAGLDVFDMRVRGVAAERFEAAFIDVMQRVQPGSVRSTRTVSGIDIVRLRWSTDPAHDLHLAVIDDIVFGFTGEPKRQADVDATIAFMRRPRLDNLLPATIAGHPTQRASVPASSIPTGGDMCVLVCPLEAPNLAKALGVPINEIDLGYAMATVPPGVYVLAFRVPGRSDAQLIAGRIKSYGRGAMIAQEDRRIGGKTVTWAAPDPFPDSGQHEYLYAHDHVLYSIRPAADEHPPNADVIEAIAALP